MIKIYFNGDLKIIDSDPAHFLAQLLRISLDSADINNWVKKTEDHGEVTPDRERSKIPPV